MSKIMKKLILILLICLLPSFGWSTTYYVKTVGGNDASAGTSEETAWAHAPGVSGWTGSGTINNGDIVYFDNASTWTASSGSGVFDLRAANNVNGGIYDGSTWGSGTRAILRATGNLTNAGYSVGTVNIGSSNITVRGFEVDGGGGIGGSYNNSGIVINWPSPICTASISNIEVSNCTVHNIGNADSFRYGLLVGAASNGYSTSDVSILNNTVYDTCHEGILIYPSDDNTGGADTITIRGNNIYNTGQQNYIFGTGIAIKNKVTNATVEFNYVHNNIASGVQIISLSGTSSYAPNSVIIRYNIISNNGTNGIYDNNSAGIAESYDIYGNLFISNGQEVARSNGIDYYVEASSSGSIIKVYNNTFYSIGKLTTNKDSIKIQAPANTLEIKNNIFYVDNHLAINDTGSVITAHNNNLFWRTSGDNNVVTYGGSSYTRSNVTNWETTAQNTDPTFKNSSNLPTGFSGTYGTDMVPNADGLSISSAPALDSGANLGSSYNGAINFSGITGSPTRSVWDIGAYEYGSGTIPKLSGISIVGGSMN
jgi:hypothetical protein